MDLKEFNLVSVGFIVLANVILLLVVLANKPKSNARRGFSLMVFMATAYILTSVLADTNINEQAQNFFLRADFIFGIFAGYSTLVFVEFFPKRLYQIRNRTLLLFLALTSIFSLLCVVSNLVILETKVVNEGITFSSGILDIPYIATIIFMTGWSVFLLYRKAKLLEGINRLQVLYVLIGLSLTIVLAMSALVYERFLINQYDYVRSATNVLLAVSISRYATFIFTMFSTIAILKHRLFGIRVILGKLIFWFSIATFLFGVFYIVALGELRTFGSFTTPEAIITNVFLAFLVAFTLSIFDKQLRTWINQKFINAAYDSEEILEQYMLAAAIAPSEEVVTAKLFETVEKTLNVKKQGLIILPVEEEAIMSFEWVNYTPDEIEALESEKVMNPLLNIMQDKALLTAEIIDKTKDETLSKMLTTNEVELVVPVQSELFGGFYFLGKREYGEAYTIEDINFLEKLILYTESGIIHARTT